MSRSNVRDVGGYQAAFEKFAPKRKNDNNDKFREKRNKPQRGKAGRDYEREER